MSFRLNLRFLVLFTSILSLHFGAQAQGGAGADQDLGIAIQPAAFDFHASPGQKIVTTVSVANSQNKPMQIKLEVGDWLRDSIGDHKYFAPASLPISCASWVKLSQSFVEIPAKGSANFELTFIAPDSPQLFKAMKWAMLFVEFAEERMIPQTSKADVNAVFVKKQRLGLHIYQTPKGVVKKGIEMVDFKSTKNAARNYAITYKNTGEIQVLSKTYMDLTGLSDASFSKRISSEAVPTFPGQTRIMELKVPADIPKGKYSVIAAVDAGEDVPLEAIQEEIELR